MSARGDDAAQSVVFQHVFVGHEVDEGLVIPQGVGINQSGEFGSCCFGFGAGFGVVDADAGGLEFFDGGVIGERLFLIGEGSTIEMMEGAGY